MYNNLSRMKSPVGRHNTLQSFKMDKVESGKGRNYAR